MAWRSVALDTTKMHASDQPYHHKDDKDQTKDAAETPAAVLTVGVVAASAAEDQDKDNDDEYQAHGAPQ